MSVLHCPARLLVARHGAADYAHPDVLSDDGGWLSETGREQVREFARSVVGRKIAAICTSTLGRAVESGAVAAEVIGVRSTVLSGLEEFSVGELAGCRNDDPDLVSVFEAWLTGDLDARIPGAESGAEVLARYRDALRGITDEHRGETVLVFSHGGVMSFALPRLGPKVRSDLARRNPLPNCAAADIAMTDGDAEILHWPT